MGSIQRRPGKSVRTIRNASTAPSGIAINSMPPAIISEFFSASQKSESSKINRKAPMPKLRLASKKGVFRRLWNAINDSGISTTTVSTTITDQRNIAVNPRHPLVGR
jgi:hypothetical protein